MTTPIYSVPNITFSSANMTTTGEKQMELASSDKSPTSYGPTCLGMSSFSGEKQIEFSSSSDKNPPRPSIFGPTCLGMSSFSSASTKSPPAYSTFSFARGRVAPEVWNPDNLSMINLQARLRTFSSWPRQLVQRPEELAQSGFYYTGQGDRTRCFYCGVDIFNWERVDNIDFEHKKFSSRCKYLEMACDI